MNNFKKPKKKSLEAWFYCFFGGFYWAGFLMPTLLVTAQPIPYFRPDKFKL